MSGPRDTTSTPGKRHGAESPPSTHCPSLSAATGDGEPTRTQIQDSPSTDNKLETLDLRPGDETDDGESDELVHDDAEGRRTRSGDGHSRATASPQKARSSARPHGVAPVSAIIVSGDGAMERLMAAEVSRGGGD